MNRYCPCALLLLCGLLLRPAPEASAQDTSIDWSRVPESKLPDKLAEVLFELEPVLAMRTSVFVPLPSAFLTEEDEDEDKESDHERHELQFNAPKEPQEAKSRQEREKDRKRDEEDEKDKHPLRRPLSFSARRNPYWNIEAHVSEIVEDLMSTAGFRFVDPEPCLKIVQDKNGKRKTLQAEDIQQVSRRTRAAVVLVPQFFRGPGWLEITAYDGRNGRVIQAARCTLEKADKDYLANTPKTNRRFIAWAESQIGNKVGRGECSDLVSAGMRQVGCAPGSPGSRDRDYGRPLRTGETPFPGDPACTDDGHHTIVVSRYLRKDCIEILHQNWNSGKEDGRKVKKEDTEMGGYRFWRLRPAPADSYAELVKTLRTKADAKRAAAEAAQAAVDRGIPGIPGQ